MTITATPAPSETTDTAAPVPTSTSSASTAADDADVFPFGESVVSADLGTVLTVSKPSDFPLSDSAYCEGDGAPQAWTITVENDGAEKFEVSQVFISVQSGETEAEQCFDSAQGIDSAPATALMPGRKVSWDIVFKVADPDDVVMEVNQDWSSDPVYFVS